MRDIDKDGRSDGTQAIRRATAILTFIAGSPANGATLREISESVQLSKSTAHRILKCLVQEHLLAQSDDARHYTIGDLTLELGLAAKTLQRAILKWRPVVERVARDTGATAYLMGRSGRECVCLAKAEGSSIVRVIPVEVGQRRPLGVGAGSAAILASMSNEECETTIALIEGYLCRYSSLDADAIRGIVRKARRTGFAESLGQVVSGVYGLGIAIPAARETAMLALSLAAHQSIATKENIAAWKSRLLEVVREQDA